MIIHGYFEDYTFQYCSGRARLYVCVLRAGPDGPGLGPGLKALGLGRALDDPQKKDLDPDPDPNL